MSPESATPSPKAKRPEVPRERWKCKTRGSHGVVQLPQKFLIKSVRAAIIQLLYFAPKAISRHRACNGRNVQYKACESCELHFRGMLVSLHTRFILCYWRHHVGNGFIPLHCEANLVPFHTLEYIPTATEEGTIQGVYFARICHMIIMFYNISSAQSVKNEK